MKKKDYNFENMCHLIKRHDVALSHQNKYYHNPESYKYPDISWCDESYEKNSIALRYNLCVIRPRLC